MDSFQAKARGPGERQLYSLMSRALRVRQRSYRTEQTYLSWVRRFIYHHGRRDPRSLGPSDVAEFLTDLAVRGKVSASTQNQALCALVFLYKEVIGGGTHDLADLDGLIRAKRPKRLPMVLTRDEVARIFGELHGVEHRIVGLLYGSGLRLSEALSLRIHDIDFSYRQIMVRGGKGDRDRRAILPRTFEAELRSQIEFALSVHRKDLAAGWGEAVLPRALARKLGGAGKNPGWQYLFCSTRRCRDPEDASIERRHHRDPSNTQKAVKRAALRAGIRKRVTTHAFRHSFATHLLEHGTDIRTLQELLGHRKLQTTMIYTHVLGEGAGAVRSPLDRLPPNDLPPIEPFDRSIDRSSEGRSWGGEGDEVGESIDDTGVAEARR